MLVEAVERTTIALELSWVDCSTEVDDQLDSWLRRKAYVGRALAKLTSTAGIVVEVEAGCSGAAE